MLKQTAQYLNTLKISYSSFSPNNKSSKIRAWPSAKVESEVCQKLILCVPDIKIYQTSKFQHHTRIIDRVIRLSKCSKLGIGVPNLYLAFQIGYWYVMCLTSKASNSFWLFSLTILWSFSRKWLVSLQDLTPHLICDLWFENLLGRFPMEWLTHEL